jgi:NAD(P)-dependent dehydrogenase (short-subunit alcohol dehydrogenase family)
MSTDELGAETTTEEVLEGVELTGKVAVVTGASGGLGEETARALASRGARVVLAARNPEKVEAAMARIRNSGVQGGIETLILDLGSFDSIRSAAAELAGRHGAINLLVLNAGVMAPPLGRTADGHELQFGTNHLGHFLFTLLLRDNLVAGAPARVVVLSSAGHRVAGMNWKDPDYERTEYHNFTAYGRSKTANALFALGLDSRMAEKGVHAYSVHPGVIMTELSRHLVPEDLEWMAARRRRATGGDGDAGDTVPADDADDGGSALDVFTFKSVEAGAATSVWAATAPELDAHGGAYLEDCHVAERVDDETATDGVAPWACDPREADRLWELSLRLVGLDG